MNCDKLFKEEVVISVMHFALTMEEWNKELNTLNHITKKFTKRN